MEKKIALSIAGSDSSAGAGIQADLKSFSYLGVYGLTVITCVTAQNTRQVRTIHKVPSTIIAEQIDSLFDDFSITGVKTGMLYDEDIVRIVAKTLNTHHVKPVVDPVMIATSGDALANSTFVDSLHKELLPHAVMVTANIPEACALAGMTIRTRKDSEDACRKIKQIGPEFVLLKGGHLPGDMVTDLLYDGRRFQAFTLPRIPQRKAHGSGCSLSALITGLLAGGEPPVSAVENAKHIVWGMINEGFSPGKGSDVLNHSPTIHIPPLTRDNEKLLVWLQLTTAIDSLGSFLPPQFIPEVGMNVAYGLADAKTRGDVCAVDGRITRHKDRAFVCGTIDFGVSKHVASIILAVMKTDATMRSAANIRYSQNTIDLCKTIGFTIGSFDRKDEPPDAPSTMEWGTKEAVMMLGSVPDVIYDTGSVGKEPMIRILGKNPGDVLSKIRKIVDASTS